MIDGISIINYNLIVNFVLFILLLIFGILTFEAEKINSSLKYSPEKGDRFCAPDIRCAAPSGAQNSQVNFTITPYSNTLSNQNIYFPHYDSDGGISTQVFNIYLAESLPVGVSPLGGLSVGFSNYSSLGTSVYLEHYYNQGSTCWDANLSHISALLALAYEGTSSNIASEANLTNTNDNVLKYNLTNTLTGLSVYTDVSGTSSLFNSTVTLYINPISGTAVASPVNNMMSNYLNTLHTVKQANTNFDNDGGTSYMRCIDPSYASVVQCPSLLNKDIVYNKSAKLYTNKKYGFVSAIQTCTPGQITSDLSSKCGVPFCYDGGNKNGNGYQTSKFDYQTTVKGLTSTNDNYQYKGQPIFGTGGVYSTLNKIGNFNLAPQAQSLLFCGGTSTTSNNIADAPFSGGGTAKFPTKNPKTTLNPEFANQPTSTVKGDKVILGFK